MEDLQEIHRGSSQLVSIHYESLRVIIEQVPQSRELLQLFSQLHHSLPIPDFEALQNSGDENGMIKFRDMQIPIRVLKDFVPPFVFPINDENDLIERLSHLIQVIPAFIGFDSSKVENIQYISQVNFLNSFKDWLKNYSVPIGEYVSKNQDE
jgi:hypothetical protein